MAALIESGYYGYRYAVYELAGKKVKKYIVLKERQIKAN
jgi:hypothetical protein